MLIDVQIDSAHYNSKAARAARRRRALGIIFGSLKRGPGQPHFRNGHVCVCVRQQYSAETSFIKVVTLLHFYERYSGP